MVTVPACIDQWYNTEAEAYACQQLAESETGQDYAVEERMSEASAEYFRNNFLRKYHGTVTEVYYRESGETAKRDEKDVLYYQLHRYRAYNILDRYAEGVRQNCDYQSNPPKYFFDRSQAQEQAAERNQESGVPQSLELFDACRISAADRSSPLYNEYLSTHGVSPESAYRVGDDLSALMEYADRWRTAHGIEFDAEDFKTRAEAETVAQTEETRTGIPQLILIDSEHSPFSPYSNDENTPWKQAYMHYFGIMPDLAYVLAADPNCTAGVQYEFTYHDSTDKKVLANACAENRTRMLGQPFEAVQQGDGYGENERSFFEIMSKK